MKELENFGYLNCMVARLLHLIVTMHDLFYVTGRFTY